MVNLDWKEHYCHCDICTGKVTASHGCTRSATDTSYSALRAYIPKPKVRKENKAVPPKRKDLYY